MILKCPKCGNTMKFFGKGQRKTCVYCGKSFSVRTQRISD